MATVTAIVETFLVRNAINPDGRSYLEVTQAYLHHDWAMTVNSYWGPLYSWILIPFLAAKPSLRHEYPLAHAVNLALFVASLLAFEFFWVHLLAYRSRQRAEEPSGAVGPPELVLWVLGYVLFTWLMVGLLPFINPDL